MNLSRHILIALANLALVLAPWLSGWSSIQAAQAANAATQTTTQATSCCGDGCCCCTEQDLPPACPCAPATPKTPSAPLPTGFATAEQAAVARPVATKTAARPRDRTRDNLIQTVHSQRTHAVLADLPSDSRPVRSMSCIIQT